MARLLVLLHIADGDVAPNADRWQDQDPKLAAADIWHHGIPKGIEVTIIEAGWVEP